MTLTLVPFVEDGRVTPRVANLSARGGFRDEHWRKVRRRLDPLDVTPIVEHYGERSRKDSVVFVAGEWWLEISESREFWCLLSLGFFLLVLGAYGLVIG